MLDWSLLKMVLIIIMKIDTDTHYVDLAFLNVFLISLAMLQGWTVGPRMLVCECGCEIGSEGRVGEG